MLRSSFLFALIALHTTNTVAFAVPSPTQLNGYSGAVGRDAVSSVSPSPTPSTDSVFLTTEHITVGGVTNDHVTIAEQTIDIVIPTCIQTITPDPNGYVPPDTCGALWDYYPNFGAAAVFAALFGILTATHIWQAIHYKKSFCWVIIMASIWETIAFTFRALSARRQQSVGIYLVFQIFVLLAPLWVNAFDYMVLGRMIYYFLPSRSLLSIPASTIAAMFVGLDFVSFIVQLVGGSMAGPTSSPADQMKAIHVYMGGIGLQQFFIVVFVLLAARFHLEMAKAGPNGHGRKGWKGLLVTLYVTLGLITVRILFRLIQFSAGHDTSNPLVSKEAYFYVLEAVPMLLAIMSFTILHPGSVLVGPDSELPGLWRIIRSCCASRRTGRKEEFIELRDAASDI